MNDRRLVSISKKLSFILRHGAERVGLPIRADGCVSVAALLTFMHIDLPALEETVARNDKRRFEFVEEAGERYLRARNGHTLNGVRPESFMAEIDGAERVAAFHAIHCTKTELIPSILQNGLCRMQRHHIHFYLLPRIGELAANRLSTLPMQRDAYIELKVSKAANAGYRFFVQSDYLLCAGIGGVIPAIYFAEIYAKANGEVGVAYRGELANARKAAKSKWLLAIGAAKQNEFEILPIFVEKNEIIWEIAFKANFLCVKSDENLTKFLSERKNENYIFVFFDSFERTNFFPKPQINLAKFAQITFRETLSNCKFAEPIANLNAESDSKAIAETALALIARGCDFTFNFTKLT